MKNFFKIISARAKKNTYFLSNENYAYLKKITKNRRE